MMTSASARIAGSLAKAITSAFLRSRLVVLIYHSVLDARDPFRPGDATAREFDAQMAMLARNFRCQTFGQAVAAFSGGDRPRNTVVVTFDDGYRDNHDRAMPVLRAHGLPATFFVATGYLDGEMMWNDILIESIRSAVGKTVDLSDYGVDKRTLHSENEAVEFCMALIKKVKKWQQDERAEFVASLSSRLNFAPRERLMMNESEVRNLSQAGMEIGAHTVSHPILSTLSDDASRLEISRSKTDLEGIVSGAVSSFAYPNGQPGTDFLARDTEIVRSAGFAAAATTSWGCLSAVVDPLMIPRQSIWGHSGAKLPLQMLRNFRGLLAPGN